MRRGAVVSLMLLAIAGAVVWLGFVPREESPGSRGAKGPAGASDVDAPPALAVPPRSAASASAAAMAVGREGAREAPGADVASGEATWTLVVTVTDAERHEAIVGAEVRAWPDADRRSAPSRGTTNEMGIARVPGMRGADADVLVLAEGYLVESGRNLWYPTPTVEQRLGVSLHRGVPFDGRVVEASGGAPIAGASVSVERHSEPVDIGPADEHGRFHVPGVEDGEDTKIRARAPGHVEGELEVRVSDGKIRPEVVTLPLIAGGAVVGVVLSPDGAPVEGADVRLIRAGIWVDLFDYDEADTPTPADGKPFASRYEYTDEILFDDLPKGLSATSGADGTFRIDGVEFGLEYRVRARHAGLADAAALDGVVVSPPTPERRVTMRLRRAANVAVRVRTDADLEPPAQTRVRLFLGARMVSPKGKPSGGRYDFVDLSPGRYGAFAQASGFLSAFGTVDVAEGATMETGLTLTRGARLAGTVVDADGKPIEGAEVSAAPVSDNEAEHGRWPSHDLETTSDENGRFEFEGLPSGPVVVKADGHSWNPYVWLRTREWIRAAAPSDDVHVVLRPLGRLRLRLLGPDRTPWTGKFALWTRRDGDDRHDLETGGDDSGECTMARLEDGRYDATIEVAGFAPIERSFVVRDGIAVDLGDVVLDAGVDVVGRVVDSAGRPIAGVDVDVAWHRKVRSDAAGGYVLRHCARRVFTARFEAHGYLSRAVALDGASSTTVETRLLRPAVVKATVRSAEGAPKAGTVIRLRPTPSDPADSGDDDESGPDGRISTRLHPGTWEAIWKDPQGVEHVLGSWTFAEGETRELDLVLPAK